VGVRIYPWFGVQPELINDGHFAKLSEYGVRLVMMLYWKHDRQNSRQFKLADKDIIQWGDVSKRSLTKARKQLAETGLVVFEKLPGGYYTYTICDPQTQKPYPGDPKHPIAPRKPKTNGSATAAVFTPKIDPVPGIDADGTEFNFGFNTTDKPALDPKSFSPFS
jgi:hypothetical protein